jgi:hypothetical protein
MMIRKRFGFACTTVSYSVRKVPLFATGIFYAIFYLGHGDLTSQFS